MTEAHHRPALRLLQVSLRVVPEDLQEALRGHSSPNLDIDRVHRDAPKHLDRLCSVYLSDAFILCDRSPRRLPVVVVGHELDARWAWIHFEYPVGETPDLRGFHLDNRVFFEIAPAQANTVLLHHGGTQTTLHFERGVRPDLIPRPPSERTATLDRP
jgi:hypothetical protein